MWRIAVWRGGLAGEGQLAGHQLVEQDAASVDIASPVDLASAALLRGHVRGRADDRADAGERGLRHVGGRVVPAGSTFTDVEDLRDPEVEHLRSLASRLERIGHEQDVLRLEVAVDDPFRVSRRERCAHLREHEHDAHLLHRPLAGERLEQVGALRQLHRDERLFALDAPVEDLDDVRVHQMRGRLRLSLEAAHDHGVTGQVLLEDLERDGAAALLIEGRVDGGHPALAEDLVDAEAPDERAPNQAVGFHPIEQAITAWSPLRTHPR
jgi:hypothetical protein